MPRPVNLCVCSSLRATVLEHSLHFWVQTNFFFETLIPPEKSSKYIPSRTKKIVFQTKYVFCLCFAFQVHSCMAPHHAFVVGGLQIFVRYTRTQAPRFRFTCARPIRKDWSVLVLHWLKRQRMRKKKQPEFRSRVTRNSHPSTHTYQGHSAPKWVSYMYMVVFTLKCMCTTMVTVTPNMHWYMVWNVVKAVRDALAHAVWPRSHGEKCFETNRPKLHLVISEIRLKSIHAGDENELNIVLTFILPCFHLRALHEVENLLAASALFSSPGQSQKRFP